MKSKLLNYSKNIQFSIMLYYALVLGLTKIRSPALYTYGADSTSK